jgi:hypothetical protein
MPDPAPAQAIVGRRKRLETYRQRYQIEDRIGPVLSLERSIDRRRARLDALSRRLVELEALLADTRAQVRSVEAELRGSAAAGVLLIDEIIDQVRQDNHEAWSPNPVIGYRVWRIEGDRVLGNQVHWPTPALDSRCLRKVPGDDVPHATWRCGPPACGIYTVKTLDMFPDDVADCRIDRSVVGIVGLSGKVVEHIHGYRGQHAGVKAVIARLDERTMRTGDPAEIAALFNAPASAVAALGTTGQHPFGEARGFLEEQHEQEMKWT